MGSLGRTICSVHLICAQIRREGIKCIKAKEYVAKVLLSNIYTVISGSDSLFRPSWKSENCTSFQQSSGLRTPKGTAYHNHNGLRNFLKEHSYLYNNQIWLILKRLLRQLRIRMHFQNGFKTIVDNITRCRHTVNNRQLWWGGFQKITTSQIHNCFTPF